MVVASTCTHTLQKMTVFWIYFQEQTRHKTAVTLPHGTTRGCFVLLWKWQLRDNVAHVPFWLRPPNFEKSVNGGLTIQFGESGAVRGKAESSHYARGIWTRELHTCIRENTLSWLRFISRWNAGQREDFVVSSWICSNNIFTAPSWIRMYVLKRASACTR